MSSDKFIIRTSIYALLSNVKSKVRTVATRCTAAVVRQRSTKIELKKYKSGVRAQYAALQRSNYSQVYIQSDRATNILISKYQPELPIIIQIIFNLCMARQG